MKGFDGSTGSQADPLSLEMLSKCYRNSVFAFAFSPLSFSIFHFFFFVVFSRAIGNVH